MVGAIGVAPIIINLPLPEPAPPTEEMEPYYLGAEERVPSHGTRLEFERDGRWYQAGEVTDAIGPHYLRIGDDQPLRELAGLTGSSEIQFVIIAETIAPAIIKLLGQRDPVPFRLIYRDGGGAVWVEDDEPMPDLSRPSGSMWEFEAYVTGFEPELGGDGILSSTLTVDLSGEPTFTVYQPGGGA